MDLLGTSSFFFNLLPFFNFQIVFSCRLVVVKYFREFSEAHSIPELYTLSRILAVATKSQLGSILAWDLDAEHLLLRELESNYDPVSTSSGKLIVCSIESHFKSSVVGMHMRGQLAPITLRRSFEGSWP